MDALFHGKSENGELMIAGRCWKYPP